MAGPNPLKGPINILQRQLQHQQLCDHRSGGIRSHAADSSAKRQPNVCLRAGGSQQQEYLDDRAVRE